MSPQRVLPGAGVGAEEAGERLLPGVDLQMSRHPRRALETFAANPARVEAIGQNSVRLALQWQQRIITPVANFLNVVAEVVIKAGRGLKA